MRLTRIVSLCAPGIYDLQYSSKDPWQFSRRMQSSICPSVRSRNVASIPTRPVVANRGAGWPYIGGTRMQSSSSITMTTSFNVAVDGVKIHYERVGNGNKVLLLMPGAFGSIKTDLKFQIENMDRDLLTVIGWDPPGYGLSRPPERDWSHDFLRRDAEYATRLMEVLGIEKYSIGGWSNGGSTAIMMAAKYPDRVNKLIVWAASAYLTPHQQEIFERNSNIDLWHPTMRASFEEVYGKEYLQKISTDGVTAYGNYLTLNKGDVCAKDLGYIKCPTLIIHGEKDDVLGRDHAEYLHANIAKSKLAILRNGRHNLHMRYYKEFNSMVEQFITNPNSQL